MRSRELAALRDEQSLELADHGGPGKVGGEQSSVPERPGAFQGSREPNRIKVPNNRSSESGSSGREPLQALAGFNERRAAERREWPAPDAEYRPPL